MFSVRTFLAYTLVYVVVFTLMFATPVDCPAEVFPLYDERTLDNRVSVEVGSTSLTDFIMTTFMSLYMPCVSAGIVSYRYRETGQL